jgi:hypothetical protein
MKKALVVGLGVAALLGANVATLLAFHRSEDPMEGLWKSLETTKIPDRSDVAPIFPEDLRAQEGRRVSLSGVVFVMNGGTEGDRVRWCVLMPRSRYGCCGISCDPRPELSVFVDCAGHDWPTDGRRQVPATVEGRLRLDRRGDSWCLTSLEDAFVTPSAP